jgi:Zn-dependent protease with chaperone function
MRTIRRLPLLWLGLTVALAFSAGAASARPYSVANPPNPASEARVGKEAMEEVKKQYKLINDPVQAKRLQTIVDTLAAASLRPDVHYHICIVDDPQENAFSIPGGYVCVTKGLLAAVQSDDELAGVLAHEMGHNCTFDDLNEANKAQQLQLPLLAAVVAAGVLGHGPGLEGALPAAMYADQGIMSHYALGIESRADHNGVEFMIKSGKYNPVGMLVFMEHLAAEERTRVQFNLGIYADHPPSVDRVAAIEKQIVAHGLSTNRRAVTKWDPPVVAPSKLGDRDAQLLSLWKEPLFSFNWAPSGTDVAGRGAAMVKALTAALAAGAEDLDFWAETQAGVTVVKGEGQTLLTVYPQDADLQNTTPEALADSVVKHLQAALAAEDLRRLFATSPPPAAGSSPHPSQMGMAY